MRQEKALLLLKNALKKIFLKVSPSFILFFHFHFLLSISLHCLLFFEMKSFAEAGPAYLRGNSTGIHLMNLFLRRFAFFHWIVKYYLG